MESPPTYFSPNATRPNFFEVLACEQLQQNTRAALKYALSVYAERYHDYLLRLFNSFDEIYLILETLVNRYYLTTWQSLVLEWYYGLKRQPVRKRHGKLQVGQTILVALVLPLLYRKIQETFDRETGGAVGRSLDRQVSMSEEAQTSRDERLRLRREYEEKLLSRFKHHRILLILAQCWLRIRSITLRLFPYFHLILTYTNIGYRFLYAFDYSSYWSISMHVLGQTYTHLAPSDYTAHEQRIERDRRSIQSSSLWNVRAWLLRLKNVGRTSVPLAVMGLRFMEWYYRESTVRRPLMEANAGEDDAIPPPPSAPVVKEMQQRLNEDVQQCPLCRRQRTNPCMVLVSGYVFCYPCIRAYVDRYVECPVTLLKVDVMDEGYLRKIYD